MRASTPCRVNRSPGRRHGCSAWHAQLVESYRAARLAQLDRAEAWSLNYATELREYFDNVELPLTFRAWLEAHRATDQLDDVGSVAA